jgi:hypothetical protein
MRLKHISFYKWLKVKIYIMRNEIKKQFWLEITLHIFKYRPDYLVLYTKIVKKT